MALTDKRKAHEVLAARSAQALESARKAQEAAEKARAERERLQNGGRK
ncbi:hypothetical protein [Streptomyces chilikensis]|uniref:Uncharacterized protein n=1 Tax=Streptomyces chilikensis TaxID=1194079 RepID=A0ABV3EJB5_9ACTN